MRQAPASPAERLRWQRHGESDSKTALNNLSGQYFTDPNLIAAGALLTAIPTLIVYFLLQRQFVSGLTLGANKGCVGTYDCNGRDNQKCMFYSDGTIRSAQSGLCLDKDLASSKVQLWSCWGGNNQKWKTS